VSLMANTVYGLFGSRREADAVVDNLRDLGYTSDEISIVMQGEGPNASPVVEGAASGATTGGIIGGVAGLLIGIGALVIPGVGALLIGGPIAAALGLTGAAATTVSGAITGALAGGLVGALVNLGVPREEAEVFERRISEGAILILTHVHEGDEDEVRRIMQDHNAEQVRSMPLKY
jgi:hypothetical protein